MDTDTTRADDDEDDTLTQQPRGLVQLLQKKIQTEPDRKNRPGSDVLGRLDAAARLEKRVFPETVSSNDVQTFVLVLLSDVFGNRGTKRLAGAFLEQYANEADQRLVQSLKDTAEQTEAAGHKYEGTAGHPGSNRLATFTSQLSRAVSHDAPTYSVAEDIRMLQTKASLVRDWERWSQSSCVDTEVATFLDGEGITQDTGVVLTARISAYLAKTTKLPATQLSKKIYGWRPISILAETFGLGVFALLPKSVTTAYNRHRMLGSKSGKKEAKFRAVMDAVVDEMPILRDVCTSLQKYIVDDILAGKPATLVEDRIPGIKMARDGDTRSLYSTPICVLLGIVTSKLPVTGTVQEIRDDEEEDDNEEEGEEEVEENEEGEEDDEFENDE